MARLGFADIAASATLGILLVASSGAHAGEGAADLTAVASAGADVLASVDAQGDEPAAQEPAEWLPSWGFRGANTLRYDHFDSKGPESSYPFEGNQVYDEFNFDFRNNDGPYSHWRGLVSGVIVNKRGNRSSVDRGFIPERMNLTREVGDRKIGDHTVPYRWEAGDFYSFSSVMTQQSSLKGMSMEVQPQFASRPDSLVLFFGSNQQSWQELFEEDVYADDISSGGLYTIETNNWGSWNFDTIYNHREAQGFVEESDHAVMSAAVEKPFEFGDHKLTFEAEEALFFGDNVLGSDKVGNGFRTEIAGKHKFRPLDYRVKTEVYDRNYSPRGAIVSSNRASGEGHVGWSFQNGIRMRGRLQGFADGFQRSDQRDTVIAGLNLSGPLGLQVLPSVKGSMDFFIQDIENDSKTTDRFSINFSTDLNSALSWGWMGRFGMLIQDTNDKTVGNRDGTTIELNSSADHDFALGPFDGVVTPGFLVRFVTSGTPESNEVQPTLAVRMGYLNHSAGFNYGAFIQERKGGATDYINHTLAADYRFEVGHNTFGTEFEYKGIGSDPGDDTDQWNVGLFWTFTFDRPPAPIDRTHPAFLEPHSALVEALVAANITRVDPAELAPGLELQSTRRRLGMLGAGQPTEQTDVDVYEYAVFSEFTQRQRLALVHDGKVVLASAAIIEFGNLGSVESDRQLFERVKRELVDRYGSPSRGLEEGAFDGNLVRDVNSKKLVRVLEWDTPNGVVRFGIPRRFDGRVRMEVQQRASFPAPRETRWSIEAVR
jgi:hypothetical protein